MLRKYITSVQSVATIYPPRQIKSAIKKRSIVTTVVKLKTLTGTGNMVKTITCVVKNA